MDLLNADGVIAGKAEPLFDGVALTASPRVRPDGGYLPPMVSYAQNFEDVMLRRALQDIQCGYYVDIGAGDPDTDSVTRWFYENGWRGVNVEPDPQYFTRLEERRLEDTNFQCAIGAANANIIFNITTPGGTSTGSAQRLTEITNLPDVTIRPMLVPSITLEQLLILSCGRVIDFLKVDAENMEYDILGSASFVSQRPRIIIAEATNLNTQIPSHQAWEPKLLCKGYKFAWFDGLNRFYIRCEDEWRLELFRVPPCVFDNFFAVTIETRVAEVTDRAVRTEADLARTLGASRAEVCEARQEAAAAAERYEAALSEANANAISARARAEAIEADLGRALAASRAEVCEARQEVAAAAERYEAALSEANANAISARARAEAIEADLGRALAASSEARREAAEVAEQYEAVANELRQTTVEFERRKAYLEDRIEKLGGDLAQREGDYRRIQQRLIQMESSRRRLFENLRQREGHCERLEQNLAQNLAQREGEVALLAAERDKATAQSLRWFEAAILDDQDGLRSRQQYPLQTRLSRSRLWSWLAREPRRRGRRLTAAADRARDRREWELAARYYRDALDLEPNRPAIWVQYGHALKEAGHPVVAERAYRISLDLDAANADTHLQLGHVLKLQGRNAEAADAYLHSLALAPGSPDATQELRGLRAVGSSSP